MYKSFFSNLLNISFIISLWSFIPTSISSTNAVTFPSFIKFLRILFIIAQKVASKFVIPKNMTVGSKKPTCIVNTLFYSSPFFILTLLKSYYRSIFVNTFLLPILSIKSVINGNGQLFFMVCIRELLRDIITWQNG